MTLTVGSLFSGIGGIDLAFMAAGFDIAWQVEKEPFCLSVLARHFPQAERFTDVFDCHDLPHVDVITAGFPCQPFSVAGKRMGEKDERYLVPEMFRVIEEVQPRVALFENVPGFASIADGDTFRDFLRTLAEMGFDAEWGHISASDFGAPHRRERWFCVAYANGRRRAQRHAAVRRISQLDAGRTIVGHTDGTGWGEQRGAVAVQAQQSPAECTGAFSGMGNAGRRRRGRHARERSGALSANRYTRDGRQAESRLGGDADGLSRGMDTPRWPARPGQPQHVYEPPRTVKDAPNRTARLKALGNAVVPQCIYPIALTIREWLQTQAETSEKAT